MHNNMVLPNSAMALSSSEMMQVEGGVSQLLTFAAGYCASKFIDDCISGKKYKTPKGFSPKSMQK